MDRLRFAVASCRAVGDEERARLLAAVDFCMGQREEVPGVYDDRVRHRSTRGRDGKRSRVKVKDVASFRLVGPRDPLDVPPALLAELEKSARGSIKLEDSGEASRRMKQVEQLAAMLKKIH